MRPWNNATAAGVRWKSSPVGIVHPVPIRLLNGRSATATWPRTSVRPSRRRVPKSIRSRPPSARTRKNKLTVPRQTPLNAWAGFFYFRRSSRTSKNPKSRDPSLKFWIKISCLKRRHEPKNRTIADGRFPLTFFTYKL